MHIHSYVFINVVIFIHSYVVTASTDQQQSLELYRDHSVPVSIHQPLQQYHATPVANQQLCQSCNQSLTQNYLSPFGSQ